MYLCSQIVGVVCRILHGFRLFDDLLCILIVLYVTDMQFIESCLQFVDLRSGCVCTLVGIIRFFINLKDDNKSQICVARNNAG